MNVLVVASFQNDGSPTANFIHNQMIAYLQAGHTVRVIAPNGWGKLDMDGRRLSSPIQVRTIDGIRHLYIRYVTLSRYGVKHFNTPSAILAIRLQWNRIFEGFRPDVIHSHTLAFESEIGAWLKRQFGCPLVVTTHGSDTNVPLEKGETALLKKYCDEADAVVAVSKQLRDNLASCKTQTPLYAVHNGFVPYIFSEERINKRNPYAMIQVGNLIASKRVDVTIRAFASLREKWSDMVLTIIGEGPMRQQLEELCTQLGVADAVRFLGQRPNSEVFDKLCESSFFVMASKPEGFGIVYLEAMAAQCVTIGTEGQGIADLIEHGENGFLVAADDSERIAVLIDDCLRNPEKAYKIAIEGRKVAAGLTWDRNAEEYIKLFQQLIGNTSSDA